MEPSPAAIQQKRGIATTLKQGVLFHAHAPEASRTPDWQLAPHEALNMAKTLTPMSADDSEKSRQALGRAMSDLMPPHVRQKFQNFGGSTARASHLHFSGLPTDVVTFSKEGHYQVSGDLGEKIIIGIGEAAEMYGHAATEDKNHTGGIISYVHEGKTTVNKLYSDPALKHMTTGVSRNTNLDVHIENARQKWPDRQAEGAATLLKNGGTSPSALILLGMSDEPMGGPRTYVAHIPDALALLPEKHIEVLHRKHYVMHSPQRWWTTTPTGKTDKNSAIISVLAKPEDTQAETPASAPDGVAQPPIATLAFYDGMMDLKPGLSTREHGEATEALHALAGAIDQIKVGKKVKQGDALIIDNHRTGHARDPFPEMPESGNGNPSPTTGPQNQEGRLLYRVNITEDLGNFAAFGRYRDPASGNIRERVMVPPHLGVA
jgi:hypothetical protein